MDPITQALWFTLMIGIVSLAVFWSVSSEQRMRNRSCLCGDPQKHHVSAGDWDSDYGDPQHIGPHYMKPGLCRKCRCRCYIPVPAGNANSRR